MDKLTTAKEDPYALNKLLFADKQSLICSNKQDLQGNHFRCGGSSAVSLNLLELNSRGLFETVFPDRVPELVNLLSSPQSLYCGFDPTADSLHIGNLLSLIVLLHGQRAGHNPIALIGGATAQIGDPSGRIKERMALSAEDVENNVLAIMENIERVIKNHSEFIYGDKNKLPEFSVKSRLNSKEGINCTEFLYQVFQAYDWLHLLEKYNCTLQIGGNDQMGNITSGFDYIRKVNKKIVFGLLVPLILNSGGQKLGKSEGNSLWLDPLKTSPYELYQYFINVADSDVERYLKLFTFLPLDEIEAVMEEQNKSPDQRHGQKKLAEQITLLVHGESGLASALRCTDVLFGDSVPALTSMKLPELLQLFKEAPTKEVVYDPKLTVFDLCHMISCFKEECNAEQIIRAGGLYINQQKVTQPDLAVKDSVHILSNNITLVRVGKKNYHIVKWSM